MLKEDTYNKGNVNLVRFSCGEMAQHKRSSQTLRTSRLAQVHEELDALDAEIFALNNDLSQSYEEEELLESPKHTGFSNKSILKTDDVEIFSRHSFQSTLSSDDSELFIPLKKPKIKGYKPPSKRALEKSARKEKQIQQIQEEQERKFMEECTFKPKINKKSKKIQYDSSHLFQSTTHKQDPPKSQRSKRRKEDPEEREEFLSRQFKRRRSASVSTIVEEIQPTKRISPEEEQKMLARLTNPRRTVVNYEENKSEPKKHDPEAFNRLVSSSISKAKREIVNNSILRPKMNSTSRRLTQGKRTDLYKESIESQQKAQLKAEEERRWREAMEENEMQHAMEERRRRRSSMRSSSVSRRSVAGMDDFLERMQKSQKEQPKVERDLPHDNVIIVRPFSFESRVKKEKESRPSDRAIADVLSEIDQLLNS